jgi:hypothetical protein
MKIRKGTILLALASSSNTNRKAFMIICFVADL